MSVYQSGILTKHGILSSLGGLSLEAFQISEIFLP